MDEARERDPNRSCKKWSLTSCLPAMKEKRCFEEEKVRKEKRREKTKQKQPKAVIKTVFELLTVLGVIIQTPGKGGWRIGGSRSN